MNNTLLLVIDVQNNFINENTQFLIDKIDKLINENKFNYIAFTKFINHKNSPFYKALNYKGCVSRLDRDIPLDTKDYKIFEKETYTAVNNELEEYLKNNEINTIYLCGIDTEACVMKTALDLFEKGYDVKVLKDYSMSHNGTEYHNFAINMLEKMIGRKNII